MPQETVEAVRAVYEHWSRGDFQADLELLDPEIVFVMHSPLPDAGTYVGIEALRDYTREFLEPWSRITVDGEVYTAAGDQVLVDVVQRGVGGGSGVPTEFRYRHVWTFRAGRVVRLESVAR